MVARKAFKVFEDASKSVRPYSRSKQIRGPPTKQSKAVLKDSINKCNVTGKSEPKTAAAAKRRQPPKRNVKPKVDEYSLENLKDIFDDEENDEESLIEFKATSTPFNSQMAVQSELDHKEISSQKQLDKEINKIHQSINKEKLIELLAYKTPTECASNESNNKSAGKKKSHKQAPKKPKAAKHPPKSVTFKAGETTEESKQSMVNESKNKKPAKPCKQNAKCKSKPGPKPNSALNSKKIPQKSPSIGTAGPTSYQKQELTYRELLQMCAKGKDPIDLLA